MSHTQKVNNKMAPLIHKSRLLNFSFFRRIFLIDGTLGRRQNTNGKARAKRQPKTPASSAVKEYLDSKPCLRLVKDYVPEIFLRKKNSPSYYTFVVDDQVAEEIVDLIKDEVKGTTPVVEVCPGLGLITRKLLSVGVRKLVVFEPRPNALLPLQQLYNDNQDTLTVVPSLFYDLPKVIRLDEGDGGDRFETIFKDIVYREWTDEPALKVISVLHSSSFARFIAKSICFPSPLQKLGRIEFFFLMLEDTYRRLLNGKTWGRINNRLLLQALFDIRELKKFPRMAFLPWDNHKTLQMLDREVHLIQVTPKAHLFELYSAGELKTLWYFVHELTRCKNHSVIRVFETWVPGSGVRLIYEGLSPMIPVRDLSANEILHLFHIFITLPEFDATDFLHIQETSSVQDVDLEDEPPEKNVTEVNESQE